MVLKGTEMGIFIGGTLVGHAKGHSIEMSGSEIDISNKDTGGWEDFISGRKNWSVSLDSIVDPEDGEGFEQAFAAFKAGTELTIVSAIDNSGSPDTGTFQLTGTVIINSISLNANDGEAVTYSSSYKGKGELNLVAAV